jgi:hypothetical protein
MKYQDKLQELGMSEQNVSASIKKSIATLNDIISSYNSAQKAKEQSDDEDEINEINSDLEEMEGDIEDLDNSLVDKIEDYHKNKDLYAEKAKKMLDAAKAKREQLLAKENGEPVAVAQATQPAQAPQPAQAKKEAPYVEAKEVPAEQPKKKTNWALWIVAGIVAIVTVNQVMIRNED